MPVQFTSVVNLVNFFCLKINHSHTDYSFSELHSLLAVCEVRGAEVVDQLTVAALRGLHHGPVGVTHQPRQLAPAQQRIVCGNKERKKEFRIFIL